jgi:hypothetical protein
MERTQFQLRLSIDIEAYPKVITGARLLPLWYGYDNAAGVLLA